MGYDRRIAGTNGVTAGARIAPVILAGGAGTRLWPVSRESLPKQFLPVVGSKTLFQETLSRLDDPEIFLPPIVVTSEAFRFYAQRQAAAIGSKARIVLEPTRRDSAPALLAAATLARKLHGDILVLALAADHVIGDRARFMDTCARAAALAESGRVVTFGVPPTGPRTAYGYICPGEPLGQDGARVVASFVEKPDSATAERYVAEGYLWNSGNLLFAADVMLAEAADFEPRMVEAVIASVDKAREDLGFLRLDPSSFAASPAKSIDYAVMEHTKLAAVVEAPFPWSDIGSWDAVAEIAEPDADGNVTRGDVTLTDCRNAFVRSDGPLVAALGIENLCVVATQDAVLIVPTQRAQEVKSLVNTLKARQRKEAEEHLQAHRPWGSYRTIHRGERTHAKQIIVEPGAKLSLQKHHHRAEHWVVVRGTAEVTVDSTVTLVHENQSIYIPMGSVHRLANPGKIPLEVIEVQTGSYLEEDDIIRLEDTYNRT